MEKFGKSEVSRNVIRFDSQRFSVPELGTGQLGQLEVRLTCHQHIMQHAYYVAWWLVLVENYFLF